MRKLSLIGSLIVHGVLLVSLSSTQPLSDHSYGPQETISVKIQFRTPEPKQSIEEKATTPPVPEVAPSVPKKVISKKIVNKAPEKKVRSEAASSTSKVQRKSTQDVHQKTKSSSTVKTPAYVSRSDYIRNPLPDYPLQSRRKGHEGTVMLLVLLKKDGHAQSVRIYQSSGYTELDKAAMKTVLTWQFTPPDTQGIQTTSLLVPIRFKLS